MTRPTPDQPKTRYLGVILTDALADALEAEARKRDVPKSQIVREMLRERYQGR